MDKTEKDVEKPVEKCACIISPIITDIESFNYKAEDIQYNKV